MNVLAGSPAQRLHPSHGFTVESTDPVHVYMVDVPMVAPGRTA